MVPIRAEFTDAQGITPGSLVRMAGVKIGEVRKVMLDPVSKRAIVEMQVEQKHTVEAVGIRGHTDRDQQQWSKPSP